MAIQFVCSACQQPIEVDDEHAGRQAGCPYCQQVVDVPTHSTYRAGTEGVGVVTESGNAPVPTPAAAPIRSCSANIGLHVEPGAVRRAVPGRALGIGALLCAAGVVALLAAILALTLPTFTGKLRELESSGPNVRPSRDDIRRVQEEVMEELMRDPAVATLSFAAELLVVVGLVLSIVSVVRSRWRSWPGIVALIVCGLCVLVFCGGFVTQLARGTGLR